MSVYVDTEQFNSDGYTVVSGLFSDDEVQSYIDHYMDMRHSGVYPGDFSGVDISGNDPLKKYPRLIHMHRWDKISLDWMLDKRLGTAFSQLIGKEPLAVQTMLYFKPAGARGQALHQDQFYLKVQPGTCIAAWMALDDCDEENGCLQVVPGTHTLPLLCPVDADTQESFTDVTVPLSDDMQPVPVVMKAGDVLFFNGQLIHGSFPNQSKDRFRRALIGHYIMANSQEVAKFYHPVLHFDGSVVELEIGEGGSQCGVWVEEDGTPVLEMIEHSQ